MSGVWTEKVKLTADQRILIIGTMHEFRDKKFHDLDVRNSIIMRIEGALTKLRNTQHIADPQASLYRLEQFVEAKSDADRQKHWKNLKRDELNLLDLLLTKSKKSNESILQYAKIAADSLKLGRGEKYGNRKNDKGMVENHNATRFLADQLAELFELQLDLRVGHAEKSVFRKLLNVVCDQVGLPELSIDAIRSITKKYNHIL
jgi:hypothetical protein